MKTEFKDLTKLEQYKKVWKDKSDEWIIERLANELTQKVEEIHRLLAENKKIKEVNTELLKALQMAKHEIETNGGTTPRTHLMPKIDSAIKKALGE